jgi:rhomboid protease GluP
MEPRDGREEASGARQARGPAEVHSGAQAEAEGKGEDQGAVEAIDVKGRATVGVLALLLAVFALEAARGAVGDETALLSMGALPNDGRLHHQYWRLVSYSALHLNLVHIALNVALLWWVGQIVERRVGAVAMLGVYLLSAIAAGLAISFVRLSQPKGGSTLGASGGICGLLACALVLLQWRNAARFEASKGVRRWLWVACAGALGASLLSGVSLAGHAAGLAAGALAGLFLSSIAARRAAGVMPI